MNAEVGLGLKSMRGLAIALLLANGAACGDDDDGKKPDNGGLLDAGNNDGVDGEKDAGVTTPVADATVDATGIDATVHAVPPLYALATYVFGDPDTNTYISFLDKIEKRANLDLKQAREMAGFANPGAYDGALFISSGDAPEMIRYETNASGIVGQGQKLSFANFTPDSAPMFANFFVDADTALITLDKTTRVLWNPTSMLIDRKVSDPPAAQTRDGLAVASYAYKAGVRADGIFQSYYWADDDFYKFHPGSQVAVFDRNDASLKTLVDVNCPFLHFATADEQGNLYFSQNGDIIGYQLLDTSAPKSCIVRFNAGESTIASGWPRNPSELVGGRPTGELTYLKDGLAVLAVYHNERATITPQTVSTDLITAANWRLWIVDLENWTAKPIEGLDWLAGTKLSTVDGRAFLFASASDFASTKVYELSGEGNATLLFETPGYAEKFLKVR